MATPPISETHIEIRRTRRARLSRWLHARAAWLVADTAAILVCAFLFVRAVS